MTGRVGRGAEWSWTGGIRGTRGIQVGETVYGWGQVALSADGEIIGGSDVAAQTRAVFDNLRAVLAEAGRVASDGEEAEDIDLEDAAEEGEFDAEVDVDVEPDLDAADVDVEPSEEEIVTEVARRVAKRILSTRH